MKTIAEIRRQNLLLLVDEHGSQDKVAELCGTSPVYINQVIRGAKDSKTGRVRQIGDDLARKLEEGCMKEIGWLDNIHYSNQQLSTAIALMEKLEPYQLTVALKIVHTLTEPVQKNGTTDD